MLDEGLEQAIGPVRTVAYVEIEAFCIWNLVAKMEAGLLDPAPVWSNLKTFPAAAFHGKIWCITGGYPCQPFSHAGQRKGEADDRHLFPHIRNIVAAVRPVCCFFENVPGHITMGYPEVYRSLRDLGYTVEAGIFSAAEIGATHNRERLFILAYSMRKELQGTMRARGRESESSNFPAPPGQPQYEWEAPRVESSVGFSAHGYNFREDLLRMAGNGVVPQTATKAFITLSERLKLTT